MASYTSYIYEILDDNGNPVYVGKANDVKDRMIRHLQSSKKATSGIGLWIKNNKKPIQYRIVYECHKHDALKLEAELIKKNIDKGIKLLNKQSVGNIKNPSIQQVEYDTIVMSTNLYIEFSPDEYNDMEKHTPSNLNFLFNSSRFKNRLKSAVIKAVKEELILI